MSRGATNMQKYKTANYILYIQVAVVADKHDEGKGKIPESIYCSYYLLNQNTGNSRRKASVNQQEKLNTGEQTQATNKKTR